MCDRFDEDEEDGPTRSGQIFFPALSTQRYDIVCEELLRHEEIIDKVVDFGCNAGKFLKKAKSKLRRAPLLIGVDLDEDVLNEAAVELYPDASDFLYKLDYPLRMKLFAGDIIQYDRRLEGTDAVVAIELIEHLKYPILEKLPEAIFGKLQPYVVIFTTPNVEYNVCFDMAGRRFRHDDHKFEWTRAQFEKWCDSITSKYQEYWVKFMGVGDPPADRKNIGYCTQIAVFRMKRAYYLALRNKKREIRKIERDQFSDPGYSSESQGLETNKYILQPYKLMHDIKFPSKASEAREGRMALELRCYCQHLMEFCNMPLENIDGALGIWFSFKDLIECDHIRRHLKTEDDLVLFLVDQGWMCNLQENLAFYEHDIVTHIQDSRSTDDEEDEFWNRDNIIVSSSDDDLGIHLMSDETSPNDDASCKESTKDEISDRESANDDSSIPNDIDTDSFSFVDDTVDCKNVTDVFLKV